MQILFLQTERVNGKGLSSSCREHIPQVRQDHEAGDEDNDPQHRAGRQDEGFLQCHQPSSEMGPHGHCRGEDLSGCDLLHPTLCCVQGLTGDSGLVLRLPVVADS